MTPETKSRSKSKPSSVKPKAKRGSPRLPEAKRGRPRLYPEHQVCIKPGCLKNAQKGINLCAAHYKRERRNTESEKPIHDYGEDYELVGTIRSYPEVEKALKQAVKESAVPTSLYDQCCKIISDGLARFEGGKPAFLSGKEMPAVEPGSLARPMEVVAIVRLPAAKFPVLDRMVEHFKTTRYLLINALVDDWYLANRLEGNISR